jgi:hypothetical protein
MMTYSIPNRSIMLKNISQLSVNINNKDYLFYCDCDSPTQDVKEFCYRILSYVSKVEEQIQAMKDKQAADLAAQEETPKVEEEKQVDQSSGLEKILHVSESKLPPDVVD